MNGPSCLGTFHGYVDLIVVMTGFDSWILGLVEPQCWTLICQSTYHVEE
jgi:hypothetical protein